MMFLMFLMMPIFLPMLPTLFAVLLQPKVSSGSQTTAVICESSLTSSNTCADTGPQSGRCILSPSSLYLSSWQGER